MTETRDCPFCGSDDVGADYDGFWTVSCGNCGAVGPGASTLLMAERYWNRMAERYWEECREQRELLAG